MAGGSSNGGGGVALKSITATVDGAFAFSSSSTKGCTVNLTADMLSKADKETLRSKELTVDEALSLLRADATVGLAAEEASRRAASFGPNALEETQRNPILVFLGFMWNPLSWVMELAAVVALVVREAVHFLFFVFWFLFSSSFGYDTRMYTSS
jgi:magnesium-transporting ATPase (P-type)